MAARRSFVAACAACTGVLLFVLAACQPAPLPPGPAPSQTLTFKTIQARTSTPLPSLLPSLTPTSVILSQTSLADLNGIHLQFWHPFLDQTADQLQALAASFNQQNTWGIQVDVRSLGGPSELSRQVVAAMAGSNASGAGEAQLPDVVIANPEQALSWQAVSPVLVDLTDYISDPVVGLTSQDLADFSPPFWNLGLSDGRQVGLPALGTVQVLFYNQTWAKELGFSQPPATTEEFRQQACKAALANRQDSSIENDGTGGWLVNSNSMTMLEWMAAFGAKIDPASDDSYTFNTPETSAAFTFLKDLVSSNCAWLGLNPQPYDYFASRHALFYSGSLEDILPQEAASTGSDAWTVIPMPGNAGRPAVTLYGQTYNILASSKARQLAAWLFVRWMDSPNQQAQLVRVTGTYPLRGSELGLLSVYRHDNPQWAAALPFAGYAHNPPVAASWNQVSSVLEDASQQLFQPETTPDQIPAILSQMDAMVVELSHETP
jgi:ABC-type glycerol-3-phosphate transport system substrate-binding protein